MSRCVRLRRWAFLVTLPAAALLVGFWGLEGGMAVLALELCLVVLLVGAAWRGRGAPNEAMLDFLMHPAARRLTRTELGLLWTVPGALVRRLRGASAGRGFSYHRGSSDLAFALALLPAAAAEVTLVELLLPERWFWPKVAVLALSVYGVLMLISLALSMRVYPHRIDDGRLELRLGRLYRAIVPLEAIQAVDLSRESVDSRTRLVLRDGGALLAVSGRVDVQISLRREIEVERPIGEPVRVSTLVIAVDDPGSFVRAIRDQTGLVSR